MNTCVNAYETINFFYDNECYFMNYETGRVERWLHVEDRWLFAVKRRCQSGESNNLTGNRCTSHILQTTVSFVIDDVEESKQWTVVRATFYSNEFVKIVEVQDFALKLF